MERIDFVVTWVDGSDPAWIEKRNKCSKEPVSESRFRDWGFLKYWFRAVEDFAPWVNKIHFITEGHLPDFLNIDHPKLNIVRHEDYIPQEYLPTFNSNTIELNIHRIEGLSEKFVYFNDDIYLNRTVKAGDFFKRNLPRDCGIINPIAPAFYNSIGNIMLNNIGLINSRYKKHQVIKKDVFKWFNYRYGVLNFLNLIFLPWPRFPGLLQTHLHSNFLKSSFDELWQEVEEVLHKTCRNRFRSNFEDINQWLIKEVQLVQAKFSPQSPRVGVYHMVRQVEDARRAAESLKKGKAMSVCINDHCDDEVYRESYEILKEAFESRLNKRSSFEI